MEEPDENQLQLITLQAIPPNFLPPHLDPFNLPIYPPPEWSYNNQIMIDVTRMVFPQLDLIMDFRLFMANVIKVTPRYRRASMIVSTPYYGLNGN